MISTQILIYTIFNPLCSSNLVVHRFIRNARNKCENRNCSGLL